MISATAILVGVALGVLASLPFALAAREQTMAAGLSAILISFVIVSAGVILARSLAPGLVLQAGIAAALTLLAVSTAIILRRWA